ncbi:Cerato-platanin [Tothia fuscella]|uniref:Cerato-platanin n=1 Tax=Tothia fuscella TaxID=1048955 RepID=A0A9P4TUU7_9PEZI|nr:Cerato-platanin [Tothia fuscella]
MKLSTFAHASVLSAAIRAARVTYDDGYDLPSRSLVEVACSDGSNGMIRRGWHFQSEIPSYPYIGGSSDIASWNSPNCGQCLAVTFERKSIYILAIDVSTGSVVNMAKKAMDDITGGRAIEVGTVDADVVAVDNKFCGV